MATKTAKPKTLKSWDEVDLALARLSRLEPARNRLVADLENQIADLKTGYAHKVSLLETEIVPLVAAVGDFVMEHRDYLTDSGDKRSRQLQHGIVGLRYGAPSLKIIGKRDTKAAWQRVVEIIQDLPTSLRRKCLRIRQEPDKDGIKAAIEDGSIDEEQRRLLGVAVMREETAYYQLTSETTPRG